jgi:arsenate reductase
MKQVLILCTGNSARSQMAEALVNHKRGDTWHAESAGTQPAARVNPYALKALAEIGIETEGSHPKNLSEFIGKPFDVVITVCDDAADNCPVWLGQGKRVHIGFPDPAEATGTDDEILAVFREVCNDIDAQILDYLDAFVTNEQQVT